MGSMVRTGTLVAALALTGCTAPAPPRAVFDAAGVTRVVLRAAAADAALAEPGAPDRVEVAGTPTGGAAGYHPADPAWRETPAEAWGLGFVARRFGPVLVVSTRNEIAFIHHHYTLAAIRLRLPPGTALVRQPRTLSGDGQPDLSPPP